MQMNVDEYRNFECREFKSVFNVEFYYKEINKLLTFLYKPNINVKIMVPGRGGQDPEIRPNPPKPKVKNRNGSGSNCKTGSNGKNSVSCG
jgi:hypothetical protein